MPASATCRNFARGGLPYGALRHSARDGARRGTRLRGAPPGARPGPATPGRRGRGGGRCVPHRRSGGPRALLTPRSASSDAPPLRVWRRGAGRQPGRLRAALLAGERRRPRATGAPARRGPHARHAVGTILAALDASGLAENTIVVYTTDHGIEFPRAKWFLYDAGIAVALLMRWPGGGITGGRVCDWLLSNVDFVPTLLDLAGVPIAQTVEGRSFAAWFADEAARRRATRSSRCSRGPTMRAAVSARATPS